MSRKTMAFVVYPGISLLELVGTRSMLGAIAYMAGYDSFVVAGQRSPISTDTPMEIIPQKTFSELPKPDGLVVIGGGAESLPALEDRNLVEYIRSAGESAGITAGVSTGSLLLGAAGLIKGRQATTHWAFADRLNALGGSYQRRSWVEAGNLYTAAGVSGGIDMAIALGAQLAGQGSAKQSQLFAEYDPHPPFGGIDWAGLDLNALAPLISQKAPAYGTSKEIAFVIYPDLTVFDLVGPLQVISTLSRLEPGIQPVVVAEHAGPVNTDIGVQMIPNRTFAELPKPVGFVVPGGDTPTLKAMSNPAMRRYIRTAAQDAEWIVSVCTGALILASVGLLEGREVTTHWAYARYLESFGARYVRKRWTHNGKIINSAGVSAGIDMGLYLAAKMAGLETARKVQLMIQYDPQPPFGGIDYDHLGLFPSLVRSVNSLRSGLYTQRPRQMIQQGI